MSLDGLKLLQTFIVIAWTLLAISFSILGSSEPRPEPTRVLFVGNSYLYYNDSLHNHVKRIAVELNYKKDEEDLKFKSATIGGARLEHHNIDWLTAPGKIGVNDGFEVVILQGGSSEPLFPESRARFIETAVNYARIVRAKGAVPMLYMTHAYVQPDHRFRADMISDIQNTYRKAGALSGSRVIPVGMAFDLSYRERPDFSLHKNFDGSHPNLRGTYLAACMVYLSLYGGDLRGLQYDYFGSLNRGDTIYLQKIAQRTLAAWQD